MLLISPFPSPPLNQIVSSPSLGVLRFDVPPDGLPCIRDWLTTWESMITGGIDLGREPISVNAIYSVVFWTIWDYLVILGNFSFYKKKIQQRCHEEIIIDGWNFKRAFSHKSQRIQTKPIGYTTHVRPRRICRSLQTVSCLEWGGWIMGQLGHVASQFPIFKWWMSHSEL